MSWLPWPVAWQRALYSAELGFYRYHPPDRHFATSLSGIPGSAEMLAELVVDAMARHQLSTLVDVGCGEATLLRAVAARTGEVRCVGIEVRQPLVPLSGVTWVVADGTAGWPAEVEPHAGTLVIANEWLDTIPCTIAAADSIGRLRTVLVDPGSGAERLGDPITAAEAVWAERWWPGPYRSGDRVEIGLARDDAWQDLLGHLHDGVAVAVDYGHRSPARPRGGTLAGYRDGRRVAPVPDGSCDLTAHVALDSLPGDRVLTQREALRALGLDSMTPPIPGSSSGPAYLQALRRVGIISRLLDPDGLGGFGWVVVRRTPQADRGGGVVTGCL